MNELVLLVSGLTIGALGMASGSTPAAESGFEATRWLLQQYLDGSGEMVPVLASTTVDARFTNGEIEGSGGCNRFFGRYTAREDDQLTVASEIGSTRMACAPETDRQEQRYLALLPRVAAWRRQEATLVLMEEDSRVLLQYVAARPVELEGTSWEVLGINNGRGGVVSTTTTPLSDAAFADGKVRGRAGCNLFTASYEVEGDRITIGEAAIGRRHCSEPDGIMEQEQQFLQALSRARSWALRSDRLELRDGKGSLQVSFKVRKATTTENEDPLALGRKVLAIRAIDLE